MDKPSEVISSQVNGDQDTNGKPPSFKDKLVGVNVQDNKVDINKDMEIELKDGDVSVSTIGSILKIDFLDQVRKELYDSIKQTIVVHLLSRGMGYKGLRDGIKSMWVMKG